MTLPPYHQRFQLTRSWSSEYPDYRAATGTARMQRWWPLYRLLQVQGFTPYQVGALIRLREEYEGGFGRRG